MNLQPHATALAALVSGAPAMVAVAPIPDVGFILQAAGVGALWAPRSCSGSSGVAVGEAFGPTPTFPDRRRPVDGPGRRRRGRL